MSAASTIGQTTILIVEDDATARDACAQLLTHAGYRTEEASSGREALTILERSQISLVLLDLQMPDLDGWGLIRTLAADDDMRRIPVIVVTGLAAKVDSPTWLNKPVRPDVLMHAIRLQLERVARPRELASDSVELERAPRQPRL
jgi:adenylate cyclase